MHFILLRISAIIKYEINKNMSLEKTLTVTSEEEKYIKESYERTDKQIDDDVQAIKEWYSKQSHLPPNEDDNRIKMILIINKFSLEKTKKKIDMYYSIKNIVPEMYENRSLLQPEFKLLTDNTIFVPLPQLTPECHRIVIFQYLNDNYSAFNINTYFKFAFAMYDLRMMYDLAIGEHLIIDLKHAKLGHLAQFTPAILKKAYKLLQNAYSDRLFGVHYVNVIPIAIPVIKVLKAILSEKLANRVHIYSDYESLHKVIPKNILPTEFEGTAGSLIKMHDEWMKCLYSKNDWLEELAKRKTNEELRIGTSLNLDIFGLCGSFRKLDVD